MSGEGFPGDKTVEVDDTREREIDVSKIVKQNGETMIDGRRQSVQQQNGKRVTRQERSFTDVASQRKVRKARVFMGIQSIGK